MYHKILILIFVSVNFAFNQTQETNLTYFNAKVNNSGVTLQWNTSNEVENLGFILNNRLLGTETWNDVASYKTDGALNGQGTVTSSTDYEYSDNIIQADSTYEYRLADVDYNGVVTYYTSLFITIKEGGTTSAKLSIEEQMYNIPQTFQITSYPNPFNPYVTIEYEILKNSHIIFTIYNITGSKVINLVNSNKYAGIHQISWNGCNKNGKPVPAGTYIGRISSPNTTKTMKLLLLK